MDLFYRGFKNGFKKNSFPQLKNKDNIVLDVWIDGLKLLKSSNKELWPILAFIVGFSNKLSFTITCFSGTENFGTSKIFWKNL